jgi:deazaflavin-dependent oxidoreductase (nitroreductase family)
MALGGFLFLLGEAGIYQSPSLAVMAGLFLIILYFNAMYVEEPELRRRFGLPYEKYCQAVPRFLPKLIRRHAMGGPMKPVQFDWARMRNIQKIHRLLYAIGLGPLVGKIVLLLTTTGRRSGKKRVTPLQYEEIDGFYYLGAARGLKADWLRNLQANPQVEIRVGAKHVWGCAEVVTDPAKFADFMEVRLERHPRMIGLIMEKAHGLPRHPSREQLEALAANEAMVIVRPLKD